MLELSLTHYCYKEVINNLKRGKKEYASGSEVWEMKSRWCSSVEGGGKVSLETMLQHALWEEVYGGKVGAVRCFSDSSTTSEQASKPALAINDS